MPDSVDSKKRSSSSYSRSKPANHGGGGGSKGKMDGAKVAKGASRSMKSAASHATHKSSFEPSKPKAGASITYHQKGGASAGFGSNPGTLNTKPLPPSQKPVAPVQKEVGLGNAKAGAYATPAAKPQQGFSLKSVTDAFTGFVSNPQAQKTALAVANPVSAVWDMAKQGLKAVEPLVPTKAIATGMNTVLGKDAAVKVATTVRDAGYALGNPEKLVADGMLKVFGKDTSVAIASNISNGAFWASKPEHAIPIGLAVASVAAAPVAAVVGGVGVTAAAVAGAGLSIASSVSEVALNYKNMSNGDLAMAAGSVALDLIPFAGKGLKYAPKVAEVLGAVPGVNKAVNAVADAAGALSKTELAEAGQKILPKVTGAVENVFEEAGKNKIVQSIVEHAQANGLMDTVKDFAKEVNPARFAQYGEAALEKAENVKQLLTEGFSGEELKHFTYDNPAFRGVYDMLTGAK